MGKSSVRDIDHGWNDIVKELKNGAGAYTKVGLQEGAKRNDDTGASVVAIAVVHEFGNQNVPERSFLRSTHDEQKTEIASLMQSEYSAILSGRSTFKRSLSLIGEWFQSKVKEKIRSNIAPALKPATIARRKKESDIALYDTGQMINSIRHVEIMPGMK